MHSSAVGSCEGASHTVTADGAVRHRTRICRRAGLRVCEGLRVWRMQSARGADADLPVLAARGEVEPRAITDCSATPRRLPRSGQKSGQIMHPAGCCPAASVVTAVGCVDSSAAGEPAKKAAIMAV